MNDNIRKLFFTSAATNDSLQDKLEEFKSLMYPEYDIPKEKLPTKFANSMARVLPVDSLDVSSDDISTHDKNYDQ